MRPARVPCIPDRLFIEIPKESWESRLCDLFPLADSYPWARTWRKNNAAAGTTTQKPLVSWRRYGVRRQMAQSSWVVTIGKVTADVSCGDRSQSNCSNAQRPQHPPNQLHASPRTRERLVRGCQPLGGVYKLQASGRIVVTTLSQDQLQQLSHKSPLSNTTTTTPTSTTHQTSWVPASAPVPAAAIAAPTAPALLAA